jgi:hypothetical protein
VILAVHTGIHWRDWLNDVPAMITALEVMAEESEHIKAGAPAPGT